MIRIYDKALIHKLMDEHRISNYFEADIEDDLVLYKFNKGEYLFRQGDVLDRLYILVSGKSKVDITKENGKSLLLCYCENYEIIGEVEYFSKTCYTTNMQAISDVYCFGLDISLLKSKYYNDAIFLRAMSERLAKKLMNNDKNNSLNLLYKLDTRLANHIITAAKDNVFEENLSNLADMLATSYRHLVRVLSKFCDKGILERKSGYYRIINKDLLEEISKQN